MVSITLRCCVSHRPTISTVDLTILKYLDEIDRSLINLHVHLFVQITIVNINTDILYSASVERRFSLASVTHSPRRNQLGDRMLVGLVMLQNNVFLRAKLQ